MVHPASPHHQPGEQAKETESKERGAEIRLRQSEFSSCKHVLLSNTTTSACHIQKRHLPQI